MLFLKRRGRFFEAKRGFLHSKETPSSWQREALFIARRRLRYGNERLSL
ncbi:hypothetical protein HMPREF0973_02546 [Prevotella veroralis F0319]|uniref:Uncharacterized protein n=1 Tax=Prevotella veroralis F0319 TaxID=649761 RepID=C9MSC7_9BACT|nr:hypothetical protein HMPREF0973_02546 [Prevotella veroralis F0319]